MSKKKGFTLIELVIVIAILVILVAIAVPRYQQSNLSAQAAAHNANVKVLRNAAVLYLVDNPQATSISESDLSPYIDGKFPTPAKALNTAKFTISVNGGDVVITPGDVQINGKNMVLATE